jgi:ATP-dependent DNA helicase RecG
LRDTEDGFRIAEEDLRLRGEGDLLGTRQSGWPGFQIARPELHGKYLGAARDDAALILSRIPHCQRRAAKRCTTCSIFSGKTKRSN